MAADGSGASHQELLCGKEETLLRIINPNVLILALLADWLDECTEQTIAAEQIQFDRNRRLLDWLKRSSRDAFDAFLRALRSNGQCHVANYIDGAPGETCYSVTCYLVLPVQVKMKAISKTELISITYR